MTTYRHPLQTARIERDKIVFMPRTIKGKAHQKGYKIGIKAFKGDRPFTDVPARPFVRFTQEDGQAFAREILRYVARGRV
jgi:hypothetical protein